MRRYHLTTFGCQMNSHDSERIKGMLESLGLGEATSKEDADIVVFNTCTIREKPDTKLSAYLGDAGARKRENPDLVIAVGGCFAEAQQERIFDLYPQVDVAFGPGSIPHLGDWVGVGGVGVERGRFGTHEHFAGHLPQHRERAAHAWVQVSMGCNSTCSYCIVPAVRGREQSRRPGDIVAEVTRLAHDGVREITLLGQNVNSWGRDLAPDIRTEFGELLRACDAVDGIERIRFTSPHPKDFREPVIAAMAECDAVCEHIHLPLQSGSTRILKAMRRTYSRERYLTLAARLREAIPDLALGTDIIVGFPGETEADFQETLEVVEEVRYDSAFTFIYSPRRGTDAAAMADQVPEPVKHERLERLVEVVQRIAAERNAERVGRVEQVLVEGPSRTDETLLRGRTRRNTTVVFTGTGEMRRPRRRHHRGLDLDDAARPHRLGRSRLTGDSDGRRHRRLRPDRLGQDRRRRGGRRPPRHGRRLVRRTAGVSGAADPDEPAEPAHRARGDPGSRRGDVGRRLRDARARGDRRARRRARHRRRERRHRAVPAGGARRLAVPPPPAPGVRERIRAEVELDPDGRARAAHLASIRALPRPSTSTTRGGSSARSSSPRWGSRSCPTTTASGRPRPGIRR